jgi:hypothetical protein
MGDFEIRSGYSLIILSCVVAILGLCYLIAISYIFNHFDATFWRSLGIVFLTIDSLNVASQAIAIYINGSFISCIKPEEYYDIKDIKDVLPTFGTLFFIEFLSKCIITVSIVFLHPSSDIINLIYISAVFLICKMIIWLGCLVFYFINRCNIKSQKELPTNT